MDNLEPLCIADRNVKWYRKEYGGSSKTKQIELPYDPEIPLLDIYSLKRNEYICSPKDMCRSVPRDNIYNNPNRKQPKFPHPRVGK